MLLKTRGIAYRVYEPIVARVTRNYLSKEQNQILIAEANLPSSNLKSFDAILTNLSIEDSKIDRPSVYSVQTFQHLVEGDIVVVNTDGIINTLYRVNSHQNFLLTTERCNSNCLMCSQPPRDKNDIPYLFNLGDYKR